MAEILIGNIKGPQGAKGDKGDKGDTGPQGPAGPQGATGPMPALVNGFTTTEAGIAALDAAAGKTLKDQLDQQNSDISEHLVMLPDGATAIQSKTGNTLRRLQMQAINDDISYFKSDDGGQTWPVSEKLITNADIAAISYNDTSADTIEDLIKSKAKIIAQNTNSNIAGLLPGGWNGRQFGFTIFSRAYDTIILAFVGNYDLYVAAYSISTETLEQLKKATLTDV